MLFGSVAAMRVFITGMAMCALANGALREVASVEIESHWRGLGEPRDASLVIRRDGATFSHEGRRIDRSLVQALVNALEARAMAAPEPLNLGLTPPTLERLRAQVTAETPEILPAQKDLLTRSFRDKAVAKRVLQGLYDVFVFDDYPAVRVRVTFSDKTELTAVSNSPSEFMLPWRIGPAEIKTFHADISRAAAALMPPGMLNRDRLRGTGFTKAFIEVLRHYIEPEWTLADAEHRAGPTLAALRKHYTIEAAEIHGSHHPEYGEEWKSGKPSQVNLHVRLRSPELPEAVSFALVLLFRDGRVEGLDRFLASAARYERVVLAVPWLNAYIRQHPGTPIRLAYIHSASMGEKAMRVFSADMKKRRREDVIDQVNADQADVALLIVGTTYAESYWLVLPDGRMLLWRHNGPTGLLKWTAEDVPRGDCADYGPPNGGCAGAWVSPDGELLRKTVHADESRLSEHRVDRTAPDHLFPVHESGRGGFIDNVGNIVIPLCFDSVGKFSEGLAPFERDGRWGYVDSTGTVVIQPRFSWASDFSEGLARVQAEGEPLGLDSRWGYIDRSGQLVIDAVFEELHGPTGEFHEGLAVVEKEGKYGFIDRTGKIRIAPQFEWVYDFKDGLTAACGESFEQCGYIEKTGRWVIPPQFKSASMFAEGLANITDEQGCGYIGPSGSVVLRPPDNTPKTDCAVASGNFSDGLARWKFGAKYGYIDRAGNAVIGPTYDLTWGFSEGLASVVVGKDHGYIDETGRMVINLGQVHTAEPFRNGLAAVVTDGKHGYIDRTGKYVWGPKAQDDE